MKKVVLRFREVDRAIFAAVKNGAKTVETRAATVKFKDLKSGDQLIMICGKDKIDKTVKKSKIFKSVDELLTSIDFKKIMPAASSAEEAKQVYDSFPGYQEKIAKFGIIALELS